VHELGRNFSTVYADGGTVVWRAPGRSIPVLLDPVEWIILQCLTEDDDPDGLVSDIVDVVGIDVVAAAARVDRACARFHALGLLGEQTTGAQSDPLFARPLSH
jgi:hypothetical protein